MPALLTVASPAVAAPRSPSSVANSTPVVPAFASPAADGEVEWFRGAFMSAQGRARHEGRMLCLYFWTNGSDNCRAMYEGTWMDPAVVSALGDYVCYSAEAADPNGARLFARYSVGTVPMVLMFDSEGEAQDAIIGHATPTTFLSELARIASGEETVGKLRALCAESPDDLSLRLRLAAKLLVIGAHAEREEVLASIRRDDPQGRTPVGARLAFWDLRDALQAELGGARDPSKVDLAPMQRLAERIEHAPVRFEAWEWLATAEGARGELAAARAALLKAWPDLASGRRLAWGSQLVASFWGMREDLDAREVRALDAIGEVVEREARAWLASNTGDGPLVPVPALEEGQTIETAVAMALAARACTLELAGQRSRARKVAREALELDSENADLVARLDPILSR